MGPIMPYAIFFNQNVAPFSSSRLQAPLSRLPLPSPFFLLISCPRKILRACMIALQTAVFSHLLISGPFLEPFYSFNLTLSGRGNISIYVGLLLSTYY